MDICIVRTTVALLIAGLMAGCAPTYVTHEMPVLSRMAPGSRAIIGDGLYRLHSTSADTLLYLPVLTAAAGNPNKSVQIKRSTHAESIDMAGVDEIILLPSARTTTRGDTLFVPVGGISTVRTVQSNPMFFFGAIIIGAGILFLVTFPSVVMHWMQPRD